MTLQESPTLEPVTLSFVLGNDLGVSDLRVSDLDMDGLGISDLGPVDLDLG